MTDDAEHGDRILVCDDCGNEQPTGILWGRPTSCECGGSYNVRVVLE